MDKPHIRVVAAEISQDGRYLITQRRPEATLPLLWEFPGGRVAAGESDADALRRALADRLGIAADIGEQVLLVSHEYDAYTIELAVFEATTADTVVPGRVHDHRWVLPEEFDQFEFPGADAQTVELLLEG